MEFDLAVSVLLVHRYTAFQKLKYEERALQIRFGTLRRFYEKRGVVEDFFNHVLTHISQKDQRFYSSS